MIGQGLTVSKVLGWILVVFGLAVAGQVAMQPLTPTTGGSVVLTLVLFGLPGVWLIRRSGRKAAQRAAARDDMADAIATAIRQDREGR